MILSNVEMQQAMLDGRLVISPQPEPLRPEEGRKCPYDTDAVDLRLGSELSVPKAGPYSFDLMQPGSLQPGSLSEFLSRNSDKHVIPETGYALQRQQFVLGLTLESISLPVEHPLNRKRKVCLAARIEGRSSVARCGVLVHFTAPTIHADWEGTLTLEIINMGPTTFTLRPGMPIAQLIVEEVKGIPFVREDRTFVGQRTPEGRLEEKKGRGGRKS